MLDPKNVSNITGRLTADPETPSENLITFSIAVDYAGPDGVGFFDVKYWTNNEGNTSNAKFLRNQITEGKLGKGSQVQLVGSLRQDRWKSDDGNRSKVLIIAESVTYAGSRPATAEGGATASAATVPAEF